MAQQIFTAHGYDFVADAMDWRDAADADEASERLGAIIQGFTAAEAADYHAKLAAAAEGEIEWDEPTLAALQKRCDAIRADVTKDYANQNFDGHNCTIAAA